MAQVPPEIIEQAQRAVEAVKKYGQVVSAYLFGSHAWGTPDEYSDIDIAVFMKDIDSWNVHRRVSVMADVQLEAGVDIEVHLFPASKLSNPDPASFSYEIIQKGIPIPEEKETALSKEQS